MELHVIYVFDRMYSYGFCRWVGQLRYAEVIVYVMYMFIYVFLLRLQRAGEANGKRWLLPIPGRGSRMPAPSR